MRFQRPSVVCRVEFGGHGRSGRGATQRLPTVESAGGSAGPDQPVEPQLPRLVQRAPQAAGQEPGPQPPPPPPFTLTPQEQSEVDRVLNVWEERNRGVKTFDCRFKRWIYDVVFGPPAISPSSSISA